MAGGRLGLGTVGFAVETSKMSELPTTTAEDARGLIDLMVEEYKSLRAEISTRLACLGTLLGFLAAGLAVMVGTGQPSSKVVLFAAPVAAAFGLGYWWYQAELIDQISGRLATVEAEMNKLAKTAFPTGHAVPFGWQDEAARNSGRIRSLLAALHMPDGRRLRSPEVGS
jgi:hypothetical protein